MPESPEESAARIAGEFYAFSPGEFMDAREAESGRRRPKAASHGWAFFVGAILLVFMALPLVLSFCSKARAQQGQCGPMDDVDATFLKSYNETISGAGIGEKDNDAWQVMVSPDGKTFTIVRVYLQMKMACIIGSGHNWAQIPVPHFSEPRSKL